MPCVFFFNDTATTEIYTLSLHDALPISARRLSIIDLAHGHQPISTEDGAVTVVQNGEIYNHEHLRDELRSEEHTSELQSRQYLVCRLLLEKKKNTLINSGCSTFSSSR